MHNANKFPSPVKPYRKNLLFHTFLCLSVRNQIMQKHQTAAVRDVLGFFPKMFPMAEHRAASTNFVLSVCHDSHCASNLKHQRWLHKHKIKNCKNRLCKTENAFIISIIGLQHEPKRQKNGKSINGNVELGGDLFSSTSLTLFGRTSDWGKSERSKFTYGNDSTFVL